MKDESLIKSGELFDPDFLGQAIMTILEPPLNSSVKSH
jgi:hypothetical protein